jgi:threonine/homoserine/homoserine lactone efflux protein
LHTECLPEVGFGPILCLDCGLGIRILDSMKSFWVPFLTFATAQFLAAASPGPSFLHVVQTSVTRSRRHGIAAAAAMALGAELWALTALLGLGVLFKRYAWLYLVAHIAGGLFLFWIAAQIWGHARSLPARDAGLNPASGRPWNSFRRALGVQMSNPKPAIFFASMFIAVFPPDASLLLKICSLGIILIDEFAWYAFVATVLSTARARAGYLKYKTRLDRTMAVVLFLLAVKLVWSV